MTSAQESRATGGRRAGQREHQVAHRAGVLGFHDEAVRLDLANPQPIDHVAGGAVVVLGKEQIGAADHLRDAEIGPRTVGIGPVQRRGVGDETFQRWSDVDQYLTVDRLETAPNRASKLSASPAYGKRPAVATSMRIGKLPQPVQVGGIQPAPSSSPVHTRTAGAFPGSG